MNAHYLFFLDAVQTETGLFNREFSRTLAVPETSVEKAFAPEFKMVDFENIATIWASGTESAPVFAGPNMAEAIQVFAAQTAVENPNFYGWQETIDLETADILYEYAGIDASSAHANAYLIGQQKQKGFNIIAQDLATALKRCELFGISSEQCL
jgi:hypothetical protein